MTPEQYREIIDRLDRIETKLNINPRFEYTLYPDGYVLPYCDHEGSYWTTGGWYCPKCNSGYGSAASEYGYHTI